MTRREVVFPDSFAWGVATSAAQAEGGIENSDWMIRERKGEAPASGEGSGKRGRYDQDFERLAAMGVKYYRTSLEWSRLEPKRGVYDREEVERLRRQFEAAERRGLKLMVALQHVTLPHWFSRLGGFADHAAIMSWHRYVEFVAKELGRHAEFWVPIHQPAAYAAGAYLLGLFGPAKKRMDKFMDGLVAVHVAHGDAYRILKAYLPGTAKVGIATLIAPTSPLDPNANADAIAADFVDAMINRPALDAIRDGVLSVPGKGMIEVPSCKGAADFFGVDYFMRLIVSGKKLAGPDARLDVLRQIEGAPGVTTSLPGDPITEHGLGACPEGLRDALIRVHRANLAAPYYITGAGVATQDEDFRARYLARTLAEVQAAIAQGLDVRGYYHWTDVDAYEWNQGYNAHYGLIGFDPQTKERTPRPAAELFTTVATTGRLTLELPDEAKPSVERAAEGE